MESEHIQIASALFVSSVVLLLLTGSVVLGWGRRFPRSGDWIVGGGWLGAVAFLAYVAVESGPGVRSLGWIWPHEEGGAATVGLMTHYLGVAASALAAAWVAVMVICKGSLEPEDRNERVFAGGAFGLAGVMISWLALTPWLSFVGMALVALGGFLGLGARANNAEDAALAARFGRERVFGLALCWLGAGAMISAGGRLAWNESFDPQGGVLGLTLLVAGLALSLMPFPFLGWAAMPSRASAITRVILAQVLPAWAAIAVFVKLEPTLRAVGLSEALGWFGFASTVLAALAALLTPSWKNALSLWVSTGFSLTLAAQGFSGPWTALAIAIGTSCCAVASALSASALEKGGVASGSGRQKALWARVVLFAGAAAASGMIGFVSAGGMIRWYASCSENPVLLSASVLAVFLSTLSAWKVAWQLGRVKNSTQAGWAQVLVPLVAIILPLGVLWVGAVTGGAMPDHSDVVTASILDGAFYGPAIEEARLFAASWYHWGGLLIVLVVAWWTSGREESSWARIRDALPRFSLFVSNAYQVDRAAQVSLGLARRVGGAAVAGVDRKIWFDRFPAMLKWIAVRSGGIAVRGDAILGRTVARGVRGTVEGPGRALQWIQNGDVQWYLFFAIGSGIALLLHFLRTS